MGFVALILALMAEQLRPLPRDNAVHRAAAALAGSVARGTDAGTPRHGAIGWTLVVGGAVLAVLLAEAVLGAIHPILVLALHVAVLYHTVGFRQFSHAFTEIQLALAANDPEGARQALQAWIRQRDPGFTVAELPVVELCRMAIAHALVAAHRHVFGPLFWYILLPGAIGPVLYRAAQFIAERWAQGGHARRGAGAIVPMDASATPADAPTVPGEPYGEFARRAYAWLDWLPVRFAAAGFAIVGNFEDAVYCWRAASAVRGGDSQRRVLLMTGGGALGLRIADPRVEADVRGLEGAGAESDPAQAIGAAVGFDWNGTEPDAAGLRSAVGLVWRSVVLWVLLFAMLTIASWLGR
ncbi:MAG TPA: cobalamin biosynthesis protein [Burkholderiaceae bacterium]|nr:cobalamin biosynthesis protein [Burkholderiaceae bacterium]